MRKEIMNPIDPTRPGPARRRRVAPAGGGFRPLGLPPGCLPLAGLLLAGLFLCGALSTPAGAEGLGYSGAGFHGGFSSRPGQMILGAHLDLGEPARDIRLLPMVELGLGSHRILFTLEQDVRCEVPVPEAGSFYFGGALALVSVHWTARTVRGQRMEGTDSNIALAGDLGFALPPEFYSAFVDLKVGITRHYPDLKFMVGATFPHGAKGAP
jgi:hypothetical protein